MHPCSFCPAWILRLTSTYLSPPVVEGLRVYGLCIHSLLALAGPITKLTHAWDSPSVIQIVCTAYDSSTGEQTWQPLIGEALSVGTGFRGDSVRCTVTEGKGRGGVKEGAAKGRGVRWRWQMAGGVEEKQLENHSPPNSIFRKSFLIRCWKEVTA